MSTNKISVPHESQTVEWKQSFGEWKEIVETCAAFATAEGGTIHVGISPDGKQAGVTIGKGSLEDMANKIKTNTANMARSPGTRYWPVPSFVRA